MTIKYMKIREFRKYLSNMGASLSRTNGSHQVWALPNGRKVSIVLGKGELSLDVMKSIKQVFKESGYKDPFSHG